MNPKIKQLTKNRLVLAAGALALSGGIAFGIAPAYQKSAMQTISVVCVDSDVGKGEQLLPEHLKTQEIPKQYLPEGVVRDTSQTAGKYAAVDLQAGDFLTQTKLSDTTDLQEWYPKLNANQVAVSVSIKTLAAGVSAQLQAGDIVSFVSANSDADTVLLPQLQYLEILEVSTPSATEYQKQQNSGESTELPATVTVLATPEQARLLADQDLNSNLHTVLVSRGNPKQAAELLAQQQEILAQQQEQPAAPSQETEADNNG